jgi:membrane protein DedA with SNARE-associated domain
MVWINVAAIVGWSRSAVLASVRAEDVPFYSRTEVLIGSAIMLALCLIVLVAWAVAWWRRR